MDFGSWKFDPITGIVTVIIAPLLLFLAKILLKYLKDLGSYALEGILYRLTHAIRHSLAGALSLKRYCRLQLSGPNQYLHVPSSRDITLDTDKAYVTMTLEHHGSQQGSYNHNDLLTVGKRIRVIGDPGSGKSTLVKRLLRDVCRNAIAKAAKARLPIIVELKNLDFPEEIPTDELGNYFYEQLRSRVEKTSVYRMDECFDTYAKTTGILLLLDGLDEVSSSAYQYIRAAILGISQKLGQLSEENVIVLTMRTQFHQQIKDDYRAEFSHVLALKPFQPSDVYEFLTRWQFEKDSTQQITRIYNELTDRPTLREMCSNPLILAMYVAEDQAAGGAVPPDTRTEFYSKVTDELILRQRLRQTGSTIARTKLKEQREHILGTLAYEHLLDPNQSANTLRWSDALEVTAKTFGCDKVEAERRFRELAKDTGLITEEKIGESFRFIHLTFCEFLAANEAVKGRKDGWTRLISTHKHFLEEEKTHLNTRLVEVLPFACGLLPRVQRHDAISDLASLGDNRLLARSFLETKLYDHNSWSDYAEAERKVLMEEPEENWDEEWLRRLHLFNVVIEDAKQCAIHMSIEKVVDTKELFQDLVATQKNSLHIIFSAYAKQDAAAAFWLAELGNLDLAREFPDIVVSNCDQRPFFALVKARALHDTDRVVFWSSLLAEAALRSSVVAAWMSESEPANEWSSYLDEIPKRQRWYRSTLVEKSFYTQCLSIALGPRAETDGKWSMLDLVKHIPKPGGLKFAHRFWGLAVGLMTIGYMIVFFFSPFNEKLLGIDKGLTLIPTITYFLITVGVLTVLYTLFIFLANRNRRLRQAYLVLLQPKPGTTPVQIRLRATTLNRIILGNTFIRKTNEFHEQRPS